MSRDLERRDFIRSAGLVAGATAAMSLFEPSAFAQGSQQGSQTGVRPVNYQPKPLSLDPKSIAGISEKATGRRFH